METKIIKFEFSITEIARKLYHAIFRKDEMEISKLVGELVSQWASFNADLHEGMNQTHV